MSALALISGALTGCGTSPACTDISVASVYPSAATADHMSVAPGDQQLFQASTHYEAPANSSGCAVPALSTKLTPAWTVSDPTNVKISSAQDATNGLATCVGTTKSAVTITALGTSTSGVSQILATATLTCK